MKQLRHRIQDLVMISFILFMAGCASHLHNTGDQLLAEQARQQFEEMKNAQAEVFATMFDNLATMSKAEVDRYQTIADRESELYARRATKMTWQEIRTGFSDTVRQMNLDVKLMENGIQQELVQTRNKRETHDTTAKTATQALTEAKAALTNWNKRVAVLEKLIEITPTIEQALTEVKDLDDFKEKAEKIVNDVQAQVKETNVKYIDSDGTEMTAPLKEELLDIFDVNDALKNGKKGVGKILAGLKSVALDDAPGLMVTIASLAKDLADLQRKGLLAEIGSLEERMVLVKRAMRLADLARELAEEGVGLVPETKFPNDTPTEETLKTLAVSQQANDLANVYLVMQYYVAVNGQMSSRVEEVRREEAYLAHRQSIEISQINTLQHQALLNRGIEGLLIYHKGGVKPEEIAELVYRVTQLGFLGWIGSGVN